MKSYTKDCSSTHNGLSIWASPYEHSRTPIAIDGDKVRILLRYLGSSAFARKWMSIEDQNRVKPTISATATLIVFVVDSNRIRENFNAFFKYSNIYHSPVS